MFYLRSARADDSNIERMFGTTERNAVDNSTMIFTHTATPRLMFLRYRIKAVLKNALNVSPSISCLGDDMETKTPVMLKIFFLLHDDQRTAIHRLLYETSVYQFVSNELCKISSLFVPWRMTYMFSGWDLDIGRWDPQDLNDYRSALAQSGHYEGYKELYAKFTSQVNVNMAFAQITNRNEKDVTLLAFLRADSGSLVMLKQIVFQCVFALACMAELRIQHNDLHINNILISFDLPKRKKGYYYKGKLFWIEQFLQIKLFDWDLAYVEPLGPNQGLNAQTFKQNGVGNVFNPRFDIYMFISSLEQFYTVNNLPIPTPIVQFFATVRPNLYQLEQNRLCNVVDGACVPFPPDEPKSLLTAEQALMLPLFSEFRVDSPFEPQNVAPGLYKFQTGSKDSWFKRTFSKSS